MKSQSNMYLFKGDLEYNNFNDIPVLINTLFFQTIQAGIVTMQVSLNATLNNTFKKVRCQTVLHSL